MEELTIVNLLTNSGFEKVLIDADFVYFQDPSCIFPAFDTILEYAWIAILVFVAIMLFGWGVLYIKNGVKIDTLFNNAKTVILILCILGAVKPIVNIIYGDNLFARQCEIKQVSRAAVNELLEMRNKKLGNSDKNLLYENFSVIDSGPVYGDDSFDDTLTEEEIETINQESENSGFAVYDIAKVESGQGYVIYIKKDGTKIKRTGGSVSWRNNNPGNIINSNFAFSNGAVGTAGRFAVFPNEDTGLNATIKLLRSKNYTNLELSKVYDRWAPEGDGNNNPSAYANYVSKHSGVHLNKKISELSDDEIMRVARAMQQFEGWSIGTEQIL